MLQRDITEDLICLAAALDRPSVLRQIRGFRGSFPVDFTAEFLETMTTDRLRHVYVAMVLQGRRATPAVRSEAAVQEPVHA